MDDFKPIELEDKDIIKKHHKKFPPMHSDNLFTTMVSWMDYSNYQYAFLEDNLIIMTNVKGTTQFRCPTGKYKKGIFKQVFQLAKKEGSDPPFGFIDNDAKDWIIKNFPKLSFFPDRDYFDYVYLVKNLAELSGSKYSKIRNRLNKFRRNHIYTIEPISDSNFNEIRSFLKRWCLWKDCESDPLLENEKNAIMYSIEHFFDLDLTGISFRINGAIEAISVFEQMSPDTAVVHYEKGSPDYDGIYKAINMETAKILQKDYMYINRQSDMNISGLRKAKMSYHPHHMAEVFHIDRKNLNF